MTAIEETIKWIDQFVIRHNLCPFAIEPYNRQLIHYTTSSAQLLPELLQEAFDQVLRLDKLSEADCSTSFFIIASAPLSFSELLETIDLLESLMEKFDLHERFQLVPFHPDFEFQGSVRDTVSNQVNQSPFPMIHILRSIQVERATANQKITDEITRRNDITLRKLSN